MNDNDVGTATYHAPRPSSHRTWSLSATRFGSSPYQLAKSILMRLLPQGNLEKHFL